MAGYLRAWFRWFGADPTRIREGGRRREWVMEKAWSDLAIPPGDTLKEELEARGMSQTDLARKMGLEEALGIPGHFWVRLEADYRYTLALQAHRVHRRGDSHGRPAVLGTMRKTAVRDAARHGATSPVFERPQRAAGRKAVAARKK